jgi:hypothetical protein
MYNDKNGFVSIEDVIGLPQNVHQCVYSDIEFEIYQISPTVLENLREQLRGINMDFDIRIVFLDPEGKVRLLF